MLHLFSPLSLLSLFLFLLAHAKNLANRVKGNLEASLVGLGVNVIEGRGVLTGKPHEVKDELTGKVYTAKVSDSLDI